MVFGKDEFRLRCKRDSDTKIEKEVPFGVSVDGTWGQIFDVAANCKVQQTQADRAEEQLQVGDA